MDMAAWLHTYGFDLNNREWASLIWLGVFAVFVLWKSKVRQGLRACIHSAFAPKLAVAWAIYLVWIAVFVVFSYATGIWKTALTKDTIVWTATAGLALVGSSTAAWKPGHFKRALLKAVGAVALLEYLVTLATFRLWVELILQPVVVLFAVASIIVKQEKERMSWQRVGNWFFLILRESARFHLYRSLLQADSLLILGPVLWVHARTRRVAVRSQLIGELSLTVSTA